MHPTGFGLWSAASASVVAFTSFTSALAASSSVASSVRLAVVVDLGLEGGNGGHERLHLFHHALILLGGVGHVAELLLHLLFSYGFCIHGCLGILLGDQLVDILVDNGGCVRLSMLQTEGIGGDS